MTSKGTAAFCVLAASVLFISACVSSPPPAAAKADTPPAKSESRSRAQDLITGGSSATPPASAASSAAPAAAAANDAPLTTAAPSEPASAVELSPAEKQYFESYLKRLKYMVVVKDKIPLDDFQIRSILSKANEYLLRQGFDVINYDQFLKNMEDQRTAYEAEVGESMSLVQYIAQKLGADVYVELDAVPRAWTENGRHYGESNFTANMFDPSTAELLSAVTFRTDRSTDTTSPQNALLNALVAGTAQFMPRVVRDSTTVLRNRYSNGIRYQLIIQKTPDSRVVSTFRRNLRSRIREIQSGPSAADQSTFDVYLFGSISDLEDACYAAFERTPGMERAYWVFTRGKTITFNSGN